MKLISPKYKVFLIRDIIDTLWKELQTWDNVWLYIKGGIVNIQIDGPLRILISTDDDYVISDPMYVYFVVNSECTVGMFLRPFYKKHYPQQQTIEYNNEFGLEDLPF